MRRWTVRFGVLAAVPISACTLLTDTDSFNSYVEPASTPDAGDERAVVEASIHEDATSTGDARGPLTPAEYGALVMSDAPAAYWRLAEASGPTAKDETNQYPGTIAGSPEYAVEGPFGVGSKAMRFKGTERINADALVNATTAAWTSATVEAWILTELSPGNEGKVVEWLGPTPSSELSLFVDDASGAFKAGIGEANLSATTIVLGSQWHHGVVVLMATTTSIYVDGKLEATSGVPFPQRPSSGGVFAIGADFDIQGGALVNDPQVSFKGRVAEVAVYDHALSPERIKAHFDAR